MRRHFPPKIIIQQARASDERRVFEQLRSRHLYRHALRTKGIGKIRFKQGQGMSNVAADGESGMWHGCIHYFSKVKGRRA